MGVLGWILGFSLLCSLLGVLAAAVFLLLPDGARNHLIPHLVSLATGTLLGAAFLGLLPEALASAGIGGAQLVPLCVLMGLVLFFLLEKMVIWRHCHERDCERHGEGPPAGPGQAAGTLILVGDAIHNFVDGVLIAGAFLTDIELGVLTSLAVVAHEIPQEVGDFVILLQSGYTPRQAFAYNLGSGLATVPGALLAWAALTSVAPALPYVLAVAAASFIYVAVADLIPGLHEKTELRESVHQVFLISAGIGLVYGLDLFMQ